MPSNEPSNRQSVNTGLRSNRTTQYYTTDACRTWQGLQTITAYKGKHSRELPSDTSLLYELNYFYALVEANNNETCMRAPAAANVSKTFKQVNLHKGPSTPLQSWSGNDKTLFQLRRLKIFCNGCLCRPFRDSTCVIAHPARSFASQCHIWHCP